MDQKVLDAQEWLNATYGGNPDFVLVPETGVTGSSTLIGLVRALQIEIGGGLPVTGTFGDATLAACPTLTEGTSENIVRILQHGLFCKGYNPVTVTGVYNANTISAVGTLQQHAGLNTSQMTEAATPIVMQAALNTEYYQLVSGGNSRIRYMQQALNRDYLAYIGIRPCDGVYSRSTNEALIYGLQAEEGIPVGVANGVFGEQTQALAPTIDDSFTAQLGYIRLIQYGLYCNGLSDESSESKYDPGSFDGYFNSTTKSALIDFQKFHKLDETGVVTLDEWMAFFVSYGNPNRPVKAMDCATVLDRPKLKALYDAGYRHIGRYLTGTVVSGGKRVRKNLTYAEVNLILNSGTYNYKDLVYFLIYQDARQYYIDNPDAENISNYFTVIQGFHDGLAAFAAAEAIGVPTGSTIYFAVDYDFTASETQSKIIPYFQSVRDAYDHWQSQVSNLNYNIGIYGARYVCTLVARAGLSTKSFVADLSRGFSGNLGYPLPDDWAYDQIQEITFNSSAGSFAIDRDVQADRAMGISSAGGYTMVNVDFEKSGYHYINKGAPIPVYQIPPTDINAPALFLMGTIPTNAFFNLLQRANTTRSNYRYVYFRDRDGNFNAGIIDGTGISEVVESFKASRVYENEDGTYDVGLSPLNTVSINNDGAYYVFTITQPLQYLNSDGVEQGSFPVNTKVALKYDALSDSQLTTAGTSFPYTTTVYYIQRPTDSDWVKPISGENYAFMSLGYEYGVEPGDRVLR